VSVCPYIRTKLGLNWFFFLFCTVGQVSWLGTTRIGFYVSQLEGIL
jgi:hypothetical protein